MRTSFAAAALLLFSLGSAACGAKGPPPTAPVPAYSKAADATWTELSTWLPGTWTATTERGTTITESFRLVSGGSALVETFGVGGNHETVSVYHRDRGSLLLTHYCAQGNQPRLRAGGTDANGITTFRFVDVTDLGGDEEVMIERRFQMRTGDGEASPPRELVQTEVYKRPDGSLDTTTLRFVRGRSDS
jgi:predicted small lipoprotein YifL